MKEPLLALVLAAGEGSRFRSETNKILHPVLGTCLLGLVLDAVAALKPDRIAVVTGRGSEDVRRYAAPWGAEFVFQAERRGAGQAVLAAKSALRPAGDVLIVPADAPLLRPAVLKALVARHRRRGNAATVLGGEDEAAVCVFDARELRTALPKLAAAGAGKEHDLTDIVGILSAGGRKVEAVPADTPGDVRRVQTRYDLGSVVDVLRDRKARELSDRGVTVLHPASAWIDLGVDIGPESVIYPSVVIEGVTTIGRAARIYPGAHLIGARLGDRVTVFSSTVIEGATIEDDVTVGPFARLRPRTVLRAGAHVGNFVEMKNTDFGRGAKAGHLSYLGDSEVQEGVNIGAGTITCNYDGVRKNRTVIEAGAFIGSGTELVAPVRVGRGAYVAAGSVITKDVSPDALAVARGRQLEKPEWAKRKRERDAAERGGKG